MSALAEIAFEDAEYRDMLDHIRSTDYDDFFRVLMALKHGQEIGELKDAYSLAQHWVNSGNVPDGRRQTAQEGLDHIWKTEPSGSSTMATITHLALEGGYWIDNDDGFELLNVEEGPPDELVAETYANGETAEAAVAPAETAPVKAPRKSNRPHNHRQALRITMNNLALEHDLAKHLRYDENLVDQDVERLLVYYPEKFFILNNVIHVANKQLWRELRQGDIVSHGLIKEMLADARQSAWWDLPDALYNKDDAGETTSVYGDQLNDSRLDSRHITDVIRSLMDSINDIRFERAEMLQVNRRERHCILPFNDGISIDLRTKELLPPEKVLPMRLMDYGWNILRPKTLSVLRSEAEDEDAAREIDHQWYTTRDHLHTRYNQIIDRVAMYACGVTKSVDVVAFPSDGGKSTIIDALRNAFGYEAFYKISAKGAMGPGAKFSNLKWKLTTAIGVFVIEIHGREIEPEDMNIWVEDMQEFEIKFSQMTEGKRIGTVMLASDETPLNFSSDNQGFKTRIKWVDNKLDVSPMDGSDYWLVNSTGGLHCLLNEFIERAYQRFQTNGEQCEPWVIRKQQEIEQEKDVAWLTSESRDPLVLTMLELFKPTDIDLDFLPTAQIMDVLKYYAKNCADSDIDVKKIPTSRQINKPFKQAFGKKYTPIGRNYKGKTTRGYAGFTLTTTGKEYIPPEKKSVKKGG